MTYYRCSFISVYRCSLNSHICVFKGFLSCRFRDSHSLKPYVKSSSVHHNEHIFYTSTFFSKHIAYCTFFFSAASSFFFAATAAFSFSSS